MRIISESRLVEFWSSRRTEDQCKVARSRFTAWRQVVRAVSWSNFGDLRQTFGSADTVGNCTVFDVGNNLFRLIARINYESGKLFVLAILEHEEYDKGRWVAACRCHEPPPARPPSAPRKRPRR